MGPKWMLGQRSPDQSCPKWAMMTDGMRDIGTPWFPKMVMLENQQIKVAKKGNIGHRRYMSVKDHRIELVGFGNGSAEISISNIEMAISAPVRQLYY